MVPRSLRSHTPHTTHRKRDTNHRKPGLRPDQHEANPISSKHRLHPNHLASYYVQDQNGNQYARTTWSVPATAPASILNGTGVFLFINTACTSCTHAGNSFQFQAGNAYTITLITQRNNQFSFTIIR